MFRYDTQIEPPAPSVEVQITNPSNELTRRVRAKLDTGAAMSVLPESAVRALRLDPMGDILCLGYDGRATRRFTYYVTLEVAETPIPMIEVTAAPRKDALLRRDVLNCFMITLDGKGLSFEISDP